MIWAMIYMYLAGCYLMVGYLLDTMFVHRLALWQVIIMVVVWPLVVLLFIGNGVLRAIWRE